MKKLLIVAALLLAGCHQQPMERKASDNRDVEVERLFSIDGCDVYRFMDGRYHYFAKCANVVTTMSEHTQSTGKSQTTYDEEITTIQQ